MKPHQQYTEEEARKLRQVVSDRLKEAVNGLPPEEVLQAFLTDPYPWTHDWPQSVVEALEGSILRLQSLASHMNASRQRAQLCAPWLPGPRELPEGWSREKVLEAVRAVDDATDPLHPRLVKDMAGVLASGMAMHPEYYERNFPLLYADGTSCKHFMPAAKQAVEVWKANIDWLLSYLRGVKHHGGGAIKLTPEEAGPLNNFMRTLHPSRHDVWLSESIEAADPDLPCFLVDVRGDAGLRAERAYHHAKKLGVPAMFRPFTLPTN